MTLSNSIYLAKRNFSLKKNNLTPKDRNFPPDLNTRNNATPVHLKEVDLDPNQDFQRSVNIQPNKLY